MGLPSTLFKIGKKGFKFKKKKFRFKAIKNAFSTFGKRAKVLKNTAALKARQAAFRNPKVVKRAKIGAAVGAGLGASAFGVHKFRSRKRGRSSRR